MKRVAFIGYGGIAQTAMRILQEHQGVKPEAVGVLELPELAAAARERLGDGVPVVETLEELLALEPDLVAECASQQAVREFGPDILKAGKDLLIISNGALADPGLYTELKNAAKSGNSQLMVPAGALGAIDALAAARLGGLTSVEQSLAKPPRAWRGTPAEALLDLDGLTQATPFFNGTARDAASQYPQNANVAATVAAAGVGFDESKVELVADPALNGPVHRIKVQGAFGNMELVLSGVTLPDNPKTSMLAALSIARALINTSDIIVV